MNKRTIVIGDVHGTGLELRALLEQCKINPGIDSVYLVGDVFDRAMHSYIVWKLIHEYSMKVLRGNHEEKMIQFFAGKREYLPFHYLWTFNNLIEHGVKVKDFVDFVNGLPLLIQDGNYVIVHGGILPENPLEENISANLYGHLPPDEPMPIPKDDDNREYWWDIYDSAKSGKTILYGHLSTHDNKARIRYNLDGKISSIGLDTAACHGGPLTGYCIETNEIVQYKSGIDYFSTLKKEFKKSKPLLNLDIINYIKQIK